MAKKNNSSKGKKRLQKRGIPRRPASRLNLTGHPAGRPAGMPTGGGNGCNPKPELRTIANAIRSAASTVQNTNINPGVPIPPNEIFNDCNHDPSLRKVGQTLRAAAAKVQAYTPPP